VNHWNQPGILGYRWLNSSWQGIFYGILVFPRIFRSWSGKNPPKAEVQYFRSGRVSHIPTFPAGDGNHSLKVLSVKGYSFCQPVCTLLFYLPSKSFVFLHDCLMAACLLLNTHQQICLFAWPVHPACLVCLNAFVLPACMGELPFHQSVFSCMQLALFSVFYLSLYLLSCNASLVHDFMPSFLNIFLVG